MKIITAQGREIDVNEDYTIPQAWNTYTSDEHNRWDFLFNRQNQILKDRACDEFFDGLNKLKLSESGIPNFEDLSERLYQETQWTIVTVPDLVPDNVFFDHLAKRQFPSANFIRSEDQLDYIQEPDIFHDVFGHVPLLTNPAYADFVQLYGKLGQRATTSETINKIARIYWFTIEFGLMQTDNGMRIYGSGIASSKEESVFSLEDDSPQRIDFNMEQIMNTSYQNNQIQDKYFIIDSFEELFKEVQKLY